MNETPSRSEPFQRCSGCRWTHCETVSACYWTARPQVVHGSAQADVVAAGDRTASSQDSAPAVAATVASLESDTPRTDAHLAHLNLPNGRKVGIPDETVAMLRQLERELACATWELNARRGADKAREEDRIRAVEELRRLRSSTKGSELADKLHAMGDDAYCHACDLSKRDLCLGEEHKIKTGSFTVENLKALEEMRREFGRAAGLWDAAKFIRQFASSAKGGSQP